MNLEHYPPLLCEHPLDRAERTTFRLVCGVCGSFWDLESLAQVVAYDAAYPAERGHFDPRVGALKVRTLHRWLRVSGVAVDGKAACEVGFGGGSCLPFLARRARRVYGIEANESAIDRVRESGVAADFLLAQALPPRLADPVDLWLFQDSFEHLPDPTAFVDWLAANSVSGAQILLVAPRADSLSRRLMGRLWIHKLPDHQFQWSRPGVVGFMARRGFAVRSVFNPLKFVSPQMAVAHALHKAGIADRARKWLGGAALAVPFNFGEMGIVFQRGG
jgi:hypothetical protein